MTDLDPRPNTIVEESATPSRTTHPGPPPKRKCGGIHHIISHASGSLSKRSCGGIHHHISPDSSRSPSKRNYRGICHHISPDTSRSHPNESMEESTTTTSRPTHPDPHPNEIIEESATTSSPTHPGPHPNGSIEESATTSRPTHPDPHPNKIIEESAATTSRPTHPDPHPNEIIEESAATPRSTHPGPHSNESVEESATHPNPYPNITVEGSATASRRTHPGPHPNESRESATPSRMDPQPHIAVEESTTAPSRTTHRDPHPNITVEESTTSRTTLPGPDPNEPSILQQIPWLAVASILVALLCTGASVGIIVLSDKRTVASWRIQPSVLLALLSSVSNAALGIAFSTGVTITWWRSAQQGTSLACLHYIWKRVELLRFFSVLAAGSDARNVVLATAFIAVVQIVNGPLLQRATYTRVEDIVTPETILLNMTSLLPEGWVARVLNASSASVYGTRDGLATAQAWWRNDTITSLNAPGYYCNGTCEGNVQGAGISYNCSSTTQALDLSTGEGSVIFAINTTMSQNATGAPVLVLQTLYSSAVNDSCVANLTIDTCYIEAGVVEYPVTIRSSAVMLNYDELDNVTVISAYVYPGDLPTAAPNTPAGTLQGLNDFYGYYLSTSTTVLDKSHYRGYSMLADMFFDTDPPTYGNNTYKACALTWTSPTEYVLNSMQDFMFRASIRASNGTVQKFTAQRTSPTLIFYSEYGFLAAALAFKLPALLIVLFLLRGWRELGRTVSFCPLETAKAFCAPVMQRAGLGSTKANEIVDDIGQTRVIYRDGRMEPQDEEQRQWPGDGTQFQAGQTRRTGETSGSQVELLWLEPMTISSQVQLRNRRQARHHFQFSV